MPLGSFTLEPGQGHRIELRNVGTEGRMKADAVRLVYEGERLMVAADAVRFVPNAISGAAYVHGDHLGTPAKMTGDAGTVIRDAAYKPFGGEASVVGSENLDLRFPGQIQDLESGRGLASLVMPLHYNYFRDYDPASGRYLQVDPIGLAGGLNTYGYVGGNPVSWIDPYGQQAVAFVSPYAGGLAVADGPAPFGDIAALCLLGVAGAIDLYIYLDGAPAVPNVSYNKPPPKDAKDPEGAKAPGKPGSDEGFEDPKGGEKWVPNPNGKGNGWEDADGNVWVPTGPGGTAHGDPHWDVQKPKSSGGGRGRRYENVYPGGRRR
jgi:RHS repeat-associated protein